MNPTLNSPKYADPKSLAFQMYKKQQDRKQRKGYPYDPQLEQRYFRRNEGSTDYATIPEVTLTGDFVISIKVLRGSLASSILSSFTDNDNKFNMFITGTGSLQFSNKVAGVSTDHISTEVIPASVLFDVGFSRVGSTLTISVGSITQDFASNTDDVVINTLCQQNNSLYLAGILANLKIYDNGTLVRNYPINDGKNILANAATALGGEIDGLTYALTTAIGGVASVVLSSLSVIGKTYLVEVSYSGVVGDASVRIGGFSGPSFTGTGTIEFVATATTTVNDILGALTGVTSGSVTVSIKESEGYGAIVNGNADDWGLFDKKANGDWKGNSLAVPPWDSVDQVLVTA